jgi:hypothetical protein
MNAASPPEFVFCMRFYRSKRDPGKIDLPVMPRDLANTSARVACDGIAIGRVVVDGRLTIPHSVEEQRALAMVREVWPEFATAVGTNCARMLESGRKLELEALASFHTKPVDELLGLNRSVG